MQINFFRIARLRTVRLAGMLIVLCFYVRFDFTCNCLLLGVGFHWIVFGNGRIDGVSVFCEMLSFAYYPFNPTYTLRQF